MGQRAFHFASRGQFLKETKKTDRAEISYTPFTITNLYKYQKGIFWDFNLPYTNTSELGQYRIK